MRILIVEDNAAVRRLIARLVAPLGAEIAECADGLEAVDACEARPPDVVLMDIAMPRGDGLAATAAITAAYPSALVVIVTNHDDAGFREVAKRAGASGYLLKEHLTELPLLVARLRNGAREPE
jgi:CheY-like chemotaxis protein